jgi:hypothetical protein
VTAQIRARAPPPAVDDQTFVVGLFTANRQVLVTASQRLNLPALADAERLVPFLSDIQFQRTLERGCSAVEDAVEAVMRALQAGPGGVLNPGLPCVRALYKLAGQFDYMAELQPSAAQLGQSGEKLGPVLTAVAVGAADKQGQLIGISHAILAFIAQFKTYAEQLLQVLFQVPLPPAKAQGAQVQLVKPVEAAQLSPSRRFNRNLQRQLNEGVVSDPAKRETAIYRVHVKTATPYFSAAERRSRVTAFEKNHNVTQFFYDLPVSESGRSFEHCGLKRMIFNLPTPMESEFHWKRSLTKSTARSKSNEFTTQQVMQAPGRLRLYCTNHSSLKSTMGLRRWQRSSWLA